MADPPPYPDADDTGVEPDRESITGAPRWVKVFGVIGIVVVLLVVVVMLVTGEEHGPWRHAPGSDTSGVEAPEGAALDGRLLAAVSAWSQ